MQLCTESTLERALSLSRMQKVANECEEIWQTDKLCTWMQTYSITQLTKVVCDIVVESFVRFKLSVFAFFFRSKSQETKQFRVCPSASQQTGSGPALIEWALACSRSYSRRSSYKRTKRAFVRPIFHPSGWLTLRNRIKVVSSALMFGQNQSKSESEHVNENENETKRNAANASLSLRTLFFGH